MTDVRENREKFKRTLSDSRDEVTADVPASALAIGPPTTTRSHVFIATAVAVFICLYLTSLHSYLLFHALAETFSSL